jgi:hypothetical protein
MFVFIIFLSHSTIHTLIKKNINTKDSKTVAEVIFTQVLLPNGILKILLDQDSLFKTDLVDILDHLGVPFHIVSPEQVFREGARAKNRVTLY